MGQRHQIYVRFPELEETETKGIAGFHHQWLYGMTAVESLARVLKFYLNSTDVDDKGNRTDHQYGPLHTNTAYGIDRQSDVIQSIYSVDVETGYWHYVHNLITDGDLGPIEDPRNGDNNDGITIIDLSKGDFRCCFMSVGHLEGEVNPTKLIPLTAREYLLCYYPKFFEKQGRRGEIDQETFDRVLKALLLIEEKSTPLTLDECRGMFPAMIPKAKKPRKTKAQKQAEEFERQLQTMADEAQKLGLNVVDNGNVISFSRGAK